MKTHAEHLTPAVETRIRLLPGNDRCVDCKAVYPQWAGVSFGVLLCLACAGKHRALGVQVSFVKSLDMDTWNSTEQRSLEIGGNAKWKAVCAGASISDLAFREMYQSGVAKAYKNRIHMTASQASSNGMTASDFLAQLAQSADAIESAGEYEKASAFSDSTSLSSSPEPQCDLLQSDSPTAAAEDGTSALRVKCTTCHSAVAIDQLDQHSKHCVVESGNSIKWQQYERTLGSPGASLGFSLTKTKGGFAEVTRVAPGGEADVARVLVGSFVVGLNDHRTSVFEEIVTLVSSLPRPIRFRFAYRPNITATRPIASISSVPEPVSVEKEVVFHETLGCSIQAQGPHCVVTEVDSDGNAQRQGVLVGTRIVEVNGRRHTNGQDAVLAIQQSARPLRIKFYRVEGLMRGWST
ncbi:hypothetical protein Poli38472_000490 [Pythium oligandrum]|uniref:Uncharacterized protein n=1 Tax=Pythium oligandrum TaxID=41045 RepID=A0A8K1FJ68_PYTOL|nr:hypothetical protein Poli38472_000490 [Pythium oligandrum]|eukprot:TMW60448.1 hypothetical protein Poli38472_000490 [Pythium oligandrum]